MMQSEYEVRLPEDIENASPYTEYFFLVQDGEDQKIRIHDYETVYKIPGLYETVVSHMLRCVSPVVVADLLVETAAKHGDDPASLRVLDFGAGIGLVGAALAKHGVKTIIGLDIIPEAKEAAERDHPHVYQHYYVEDIVHLSPQTRATLDRTGVNSLICVSAMDAGHILPEAFAHAFNLISNGGWAAFNLKADHLQADTDDVGFAVSLRQMVEKGWFEIKAEHPYRHRVLTDGTGVDYVAIVGRKKKDIRWSTDH